MDLEGSESKIARDRDGKTWYLKIVISGHYYRTFKEGIKTINCRHIYPET